LKRFYSPIGCPVIVTEPTTSETVKLTLNSYFATLISFWNEIDLVARASGTSTDEVARLARLSPRVSAYGTEFFGSPFGGKCLPKDLEQTIRFAREVGVNPSLLEAVREFNRTFNAHSV
jgi:UDPglucose 6-dehydrogenase